MLGPFNKKKYTQSTTFFDVTTHQAYVCMKIYSAEEMAHSTKKKLELAIPPGTSKINPRGFFRGRGTLRNFFLKEGLIFFSIFYISGSNSPIFKIQKTIQLIFQF